MIWRNDYCTYMKVSRMLIGNTPMLELKRFGSVWKTCRAHLCQAGVLQSPGLHQGSAALYMINEAQKSGKIREGTVVIRTPASRAYRTGLAYICATRGIRLVLRHARRT